MIRVPTKPRLLDGYIQVSRVAGREGASYISPDHQREHIESWAKFQDVEIAHWEIDEDQSGGTQDRPGFRRIMARIQAHEIDGIVCWKLHRFARNVAGAICDVEAIQNVGAHLACVDDQIDPTGPFGNFVLTVMLAIGGGEVQTEVVGNETILRGTEPFHLSVPAPRDKKPPVGKVLTFLKDSEGVTEDMFIGEHALSPAELANFAPQPLKQGFKQP